MITFPSFVHGITPLSKAERSRAWVAVGLARNQKTAMDNSFTLWTTPMYQEGFSNRL